MAAPAPGAPAQQQPNEFDLARKRAQQQSNAAVQQQRDAIKRRAAAQGGLNSGAFVKQEQHAMQQGQEQLGQANEQIDTAQRAEARRVKEIEDQRNFQKAEREAAQKFAAAESALARGMQEKQFQATFGLSKEQFEAQKAQFAAQMTGKYKGADGKEVDTLAKQQYDWMKGQADKEYDEAQKVNQITTMLSAKNSGLSEGAIAELLEFYRTGKPVSPTWPNVQAPTPGFTPPPPVNNTSQPTSGYQPAGAGTSAGYVYNKPKYGAG